MNVYTEPKSRGSLNFDVRDICTTQENAEDCGEMDGKSAPLSLRDLAPSSRQSVGVIWFVDGGIRALPRSLQLREITLLMPLSGRVEP